MNGITKPPWWQGSDTSTGRSESHDSKVHQMDRPDASKPNKGKGKGKAAGKKRAMNASLERWRETYKGGYNESATTYGPGLTSQWYDRPKRNIEVRKLVVDNPDTNATGMQGFLSKNAVLTPINAHAAQSAKGIPPAVDSGVWIPEALVQANAAQTLLELLRSPRTSTAMLSSNLSHDVQVSSLTSTKNRQQYKSTRTRSEDVYEPEVAMTDPNVVSMPRMPSSRIQVPGRTFESRVWNGEELNGSYRGEG